jgi:hypothetical protein
MHVTSIPLPSLRFLPFVVIEGYFRMTKNFKERAVQLCRSSDRSPLRCTLVPLQDPSITLEQFVTTFLRDEREGRRQNQIQNNRRTTKKMPSHAPSFRIQVLLFPSPHRRYWVEDSQMVENGTKKIVA